MKSASSGRGFWMGSVPRVSVFGLLLAVSEPLRDQPEFFHGFDEELPISRAAGTMDSVILAVATCLVKHFSLKLLTLSGAIAVSLLLLNRSALLRFIAQISQHQKIAPPADSTDGFRREFSEPTSSAHLEKPGTGQDIQHASPTITTPGITLKMYSNEKYWFSIQYPCNAACVASPPRPYTNTYVLTEIWFPTLNEKTKVVLTVFTDESIQSWNSALEGPDTPYPYALEGLKRALELPVRAECHIYGHNEPTETVDDVKKCTVTLIDGQKALKLIVASEGVNDTGAKIRFIVRRQKDVWLEVDELFFTYDSNVAFLLDNSKASNEQREQLTAAEEVLGTLTFVQL